MGAFVLPLENMSDRHYGLTPALAEAYLEAARVSLDRHHTSPQDFIIKNGKEEQIASVRWLLADDRTQGAWANKDDATRDGAYACAIATGELALKLFAVRRMETLTGADYYLSSTPGPVEDLEDCLRLEVSGTHLDQYDVQRRLLSKVRQAKEGNSNLPAIAIVVGFRVKLISMQFVEEQIL